MRIAIWIVVAALLLGPLGLGSLSVWAATDLDNPIEHEQHPATGGENHSHDGMIICGPSACAPALLARGYGEYISARPVNRSSWSLLNDSDVSSAITQRDPPVPRISLR